MHVSQITIRAGLFGLIGLFILNGSAAQENQGQTAHAAGLIPLDAPQIEKIISSWPRITRVGINHLGFDRVNKVRLEKGKAPLDPLLIKPVCGEVDSALAIMSAATRPAVVNEDFAADLPVSVDNSLLRFFPPIRDQGSLGACVSFATTYTQLSYMTAFQRNLDIRDPADNTNKYSPKWTYNMVNGGGDNGSTFGESYELLENHGAATWAEFPYDTDFRAWCLNGAAWRNALGVRTQASQYVSDASTDTGLELVKALLTDGYVMVFGTFIGSWGFKTITDDPSTSDDNAAVGKGVGYWLSGSVGSHAMTIVGYNDAIWTDINSNGFIDPGEKGAFRIANSWGTGWGEAGFTWLAYDALRSNSKVPDGPSADRNEAFQGDIAFVLAARNNYAPLMIAEFSVSSAKRNQILFILGRSDTSATFPATWWKPAAFQRQGGPYAFDGSSTAVSGAFVLDLSDILVAGAGPQRYYLSLYDNTDGDPATLSAFKLIDLTTDPPWESACTLVPQTADDLQIYPYVDHDYLGPDQNDPPQLSYIGVSPLTGRPGTTFTFDVHYYDPEGDVPPVTNVVIDGAPQPMTLVSGEQPAHGVYRFAGQFAVGAHIFHCYFEDGRGGSARTPLAGAMSGPFVYSHVISSLWPGQVMTGGPSFVMTVTGSDLPTGSVVTWDGSDRPTTFISGSRVDAEIGAGDLIPGRMVAIAVRDPGGGYGNVVTFTVSNPMPHLTSLSPAATSGGGPGIELTLFGSEFVSNSVVRWNGVPRPTTYISSTELRASLSALDVGVGGQYKVTVRNPAPDGGDSYERSFGVSSFTIDAVSTLNVGAGQSVSGNVLVLPENGSFDSPVSFSCSGLPRGCTASFSPATVTPGVHSASSKLTIVTTARSSSAAAAVVGPGSLIPPATGMILVLALFGALAAPTLLRRITPSRPGLRRLATALLIVLIVWLAACGAGGGGGAHNQGTPAGTYQLLLQGYSGSLSSMTYLTLTVQ